MAKLLAQVLLDGPFCVQITTSNDPDDVNAGGTLDVFVNSEMVATGNHDFAEAVFEQCYSSMPRVEIRNPTADGWQGFIRYSRDGGTTFTSAQCVVCTDGGGENGFVVDGDSNGSGSLFACLNGELCLVSPQGAFFDLVSADNYCSNRGGVGGSTLMSVQKAVGDLNACAEAVRSNVLCGHQSSAAFLCLQVFKVFAVTF